MYLERPLVGRLMLHHHPKGSGLQRSGRGAKVRLMYGLRGSHIGPQLDGDDYHRSWWRSSRGKGVRGFKGSWK